MPFTIGKVFSDEAMNLLERRREADRENAQKAYSLDLQRHGMLMDNKQKQRELDLRAQDLAGNSDDRAARLEMAKVDQAQTARKTDLDAQQFQQSMGQRQSEFNAEKEQKKSALDLSGREQDWRELAGAADINQSKRRLDLTEKDLADTATHRAWERDTKFPAEMDVKQSDLDLKAMLAEQRSKEIDSRVNQRLAQTNLTQVQAKAIMDNLKIKDLNGALAHAKVLIQRYEAVANGMNGPASEADVRGAQQEMDDYLTALKAADSSAYSTVMRATGGSAATASGSPFGKTGYGSEADVLRSLMKDAGSGKPPVIPGAGR